jgi:hypothetical protein
MGCMVCRSASTVKLNVWRCPDDRRDLAAGRWETVYVQVDDTFLQMRQQIFAKKMLNLNDNWTLEIPGIGNFGPENEEEYDRRIRDYHNFGRVRTVHVRNWVNPLAPAHAF